jgi:hypothetical protein
MMASKVGAIGAPRIRTDRAYLWRSSQCFGMLNYRLGRQKRRAGEAIMGGGDDTMMDRQEGVHRTAGWVPMGVEDERAEG